MASAVARPQIAQPPLVLYEAAVLQIAQIKEKSAAARPFSRANNK
jgi:hypothetical protein